MEKRKIILIGKTGDGKSSAGNTILGRKVFTPSAGANSAAHEHVTGHAEVHGRKITVIDTPGFFTDRKDEETNSEIIKALVECAPEIHAFVLVLKVGRYTKHEEEVIETFLSLMKEEHVLKHTVVLFTFGKQLNRLTLEQFIKTSPRLTALIEKCEGRCHVIDNKFSKTRLLKKTVKDLLTTIDVMVQKNGCFTTKMLQAVDKAIQEEMKINQYKQQEKAKEIVRRTILQKVAGVATGMLLGAILGAGVIFAAGVASLKPLKLLIDLAKNLNAAIGGAAASAAAGVNTGAVLASSVLGVGAVLGATGGAVIGWKVAKEADTVNEAIRNTAKANCDIAEDVIKKVQEIVALVFKYYS